MPNSTSLNNTKPCLTCCRGEEGGGGQEGGERRHARGLERRAGCRDPAVLSPIKHQQYGCSKVISLTNPSTYGLLFLVVKLS
jgi:hypothetical protein